MVDRLSAHISVQASRVLLELAARGREGIADGEVDVLVCGIGAWRRAGDQVRPGNADVNLDPKPTGLLAVPVGQLDGHAAADDARKDVVEVRRPLPDVLFESFASGNSVKTNLKGCLHGQTVMQSAGQPRPIHSWSASE